MLNGEQRKVGAQRQKANIKVSIKSEFFEGHKGRMEIVEGKPF